MNRRETVAIEGGDVEGNKSKHRAADGAQTERTLQSQDRRGAGRNE